MNTLTLGDPVANDREALQEFIDALADYAPTIERDVSRLRSKPDDGALIGSLFRTLHNIKGDAALCRVDAALALVHPMESVLARVREGDLAFNDSLADALLLTIDRLDLTVNRLAAAEGLDDLRLLPLIEGLERLAAAKRTRVDACVAELIQAVTGAPPAAAFSRSTAVRSSDIEGSGSPPADDMLFFLKLANQFEMRSPRFAGRSMRLLRLALETNQAAGDPIDPVQLEAAVYMHDIGMMFLPESLWLRASALTSAEHGLMHAHTSYAAGLLSRMGAWSSAAEMVAQHHEMPDGRGYPEGLSAAQICPGAKLLAIVDAFEAVLLKNADHGRKRSLLRAIAEVNACDRQFAPEWIAPFNEVIRRAAEKR